MRTDEHMNPCAFTTDIARQAGLKAGVDYNDGATFPAPSTLKTAKILGDPILVSIRVIDAIGYYTRAGGQRWSYIAIPRFIWDALSLDQKRDVVGFHYKNEGGTAMRGLFPNYGQR